MGGREAGEKLEHNSSMHCGSHTTPAPLLPHCSPPAPHQ